MLEAAKGGSSDVLRTCRDNGGVSSRISIVIPFTEIPLNSPAPNTEEDPRIAIQKSV